MRKEKSCHFRCHWLDSSNKSRKFLFSRKRKFCHFRYFACRTNQIRLFCHFKTLWFFKEIILPILQIWPELKVSKNKSVIYPTFSNYGQKNSESGHKYNRNATENSIFWRENCNCLYFFSYSVILISNLYSRWLKSLLFELKIVGTPYSLGSFSLILR